MRKQVKIQGSSIVSIEKHTDLKDGYIEITDTEYTFIKENMSCVYYDNGFKVNNEQQQSINAQCVTNEIVCKITKLLATKNAMTFLGADTSDIDVILNELKTEYNNSI